VREACSPGISLAGNGRSTIGKRGRPVVRSNSQRIPCLLVCATASTRRPPRVTVTSAGGAGKSRSQMS
jgi:hypothetical protein